MMDTIQALRAFVRVVEIGSFTAVANEMNTSQSAIGRQITRLEEHFGLRLLHRTTRHLSLTDDGKRLHGYATTLLDTVEGMEASIGQNSSSPTGHVRVGTVVSLGLLLVSCLPLLIARYPGLSIELVMEDEPGDMIEERLDLAIRIGEITHPSVIKRSLGTAVRIAVATPGYIELRGSPRHADDILGHDCIVRHVARGDATWHMIGPDGPVDIAVHGAVSANNHEAVRNAALGGLGIALLPEYQVVDDIRACRLQRVLPEYTSETQPAYIIYPSRRLLAPRTRVVIDFMTEEVGRLRSRRIDYATLPGDEGKPRDCKVVALAA
jgi:DNA-binding transcriptional LysR family regulator